MKYPAFKRRNNLRKGEIEYLYIRTVSFFSVFCKDQRWQDLKFSALPLNCLRERKPASELQHYWSSLRYGNIPTCSLWVETVLVTRCYRCSRVTLIPLTAATITGHIQSIIAQFPMPPFLEGKGQRAWPSWSPCCWGGVHQIQVLGPEDEPGVGSLGWPKFVTHSLAVAGHCLWHPMMKFQELLHLGKWLLSCAAQYLLTPTTQATFSVTVCLASHWLVTLIAWGPEMGSAVLLCGTSWSHHQLISHCLHKREKGCTAELCQKSPGGLFSQGKVSRAADFVAGTKGWK